MTKRRKSRKRSSRKKGFSLRSVLLILLILGALLAGQRLGLFQVNWEAVLEEGDLSRAIVQEPAVVIEPVTGEWYRLYFTSPQYPDEPDTRVDLIEQGLIEVIDSAQESLDIAIYELDLERVGNAIIAARERGVTVRLVTDSDTLEEDETLIRLKEEGFAIVPDERSPIMHNKFVVVDGQAVWTGSWNFTENGTFRNNNHGIFIGSRQLARNYRTEFEEMFSQKAFGPTSRANTPNLRIELGDTMIETCFAPEDNCSEQLIDLIEQAEQRIRFMAFSFTHDKIGEAVSEQAKAGVAVQGVFESRGSDTEYSEFGRLKAQGLDVWPDGNPYTMHHKVFIVDDSTVVLGSYNFSENADTANDENLLVIHSPELAAEFGAEFERVYAQARRGSDQ